MGIRSKRANGNAHPQSSQRGENMTKLMRGDCLERMQELIDGYYTVDMILSDLPYENPSAKGWAGERNSFDRLWSYYKTLLKSNGVVILLGTGIYAHHMIASNLSWYKYTLIYDKQRSGDWLNSKIRPMRSHEDVMVFYKNKPTYNPRYNGEKDYPLSVMHFPRENDRNHPAQHPVALYEHLVRLYTNEGDTVLDSCMGSGTTGIACVNANRNFIGIELDKTHYNTAKTRIKQAKGVMS